ncbi:MAG: ribosomal-protein-alanine N-acetyltransferase [Burkholderiaceae bacterium]|nr:ribosomal-protein-alanine N-acetyltransferase [Burkholderiaceae bacterium]
MLDVLLRQLTSRDYDEVMRIELESFQYAWTEDDFRNTLHNQGIGMVAGVNGKIAGFMIYELFEDEYHLLNFAVSQDFRRQGVGTQMIEKLMARLTRNRPTLRIEVREKNMAAQKFFSKCGFKAWEVVREFYENPVEDAYRAFRFMPVVKEAECQ